MKSFDVLVIGAGMAGASIAYELASDRTVCVLEMEDRIGFHTTGRSVATFLESYGGRTIRALTTSSRSFMENPPDGFNRPLLKPLMLIWVATYGQESDLRDMAASVSEFVTMDLLDAHAVTQTAPVFQPGWLTLGLHEPGASEVDVAGLHNGFAGGSRRRGSELHLHAKVVALDRVGDRWQATDTNGERYEAPIVVNAAGAWADTVARLARVAPIDIRPLRRTVLTFAPPSHVDPHRLPLVGDVAGTFYFKPEGPNVLMSPADEVPSEPCDAQPEELDVARAIDVINQATTFNVRSVKSAWAGLRSFVADRSPVAGFDDQAEGFFWFVGQGGYGIQIAPALARAGASIIRDGSLPADLHAHGLTVEMLGRKRLAGAAER